MVSRRFSLLLIAALAFICPACSAVLHYQPPEPTAASVGTVKTTVLVAAMGSVQTKVDDHLGWSQSYWLPIHWTAEDRAREPLILHRWLAESLASDLRARGYAVQVAPKSGAFQTIEEAHKAGREANTDRVVAIKLRRLGSFTGGYIVIPLVNVMSARLTVDFSVFDAGGKMLVEKTIEERHVSAQGWKILILDSPFDALWGKRWFQKEFPERLMPRVFGQIAAELDAQSVAGR